MPQTTTSKIFCSSKRKPDAQPREHRRRGPAHVTGLDAERLGLVEVDLDLERRLRHRVLDAERGDAVDLGQLRLQSPLRLLPERVEVLAEHPNREVLALHAVGGPQHVSIRSVGRSHDGLEAGVDRARPPSMEESVSS